MSAMMAVATNRFVVEFTFLWWLTSDSSAQAAIAMIGDMNDRCSRRILIRRLTLLSIVLAARRGGRSVVLGQEPVDTPYLVTPDWLAAKLGRADAGILLIDASDIRDYRSSHIPGAIHSWWMETVERDYPHFGTVLNQKSADAQFDDQGKRRAWMARHGVEDHLHVVVYDRNGGDRAARIVWFLRFLGHERASVLDSGFAGWKTRGLATSNAIEQVSSGTQIAPVVPRDGFYVSTSQVAGLLESGDIVLVDVRTDAERLDTVDEQYPIGAIPGSIRLPRDARSFQIADTDKAFEPSNTIAELDAAGIRNDDRVVLYGRFGTDANRMWLVMKACGLSSVEIYDRGWVEWSTSEQPRVPIT